MYRLTASPPLSRPIRRSLGAVRRPVVAALVAALLVLVACSDGAADETVTRRKRAPVAPGDRGWLEDGADEWSEDGASGGTGDRAASAEGEAPSAGVPETSVGPDDVAPEEPADPRLAAGRIDDNAAWEQYLQYRSRAGRAGVPLGPVDVDARRVITVLDSDDRPVRGALVEILDSEGDPVAKVRTHADGRAVAFAAPAGAGGGQQGAGATTTYRVTGPGGRTELDVAAEETAPRLRLTAARPSTAPAIEVVFVLDATGSMGDEIERLKANVAAVADRVTELSGSPDVRFGMTVYRDAGDVFVTRNFDLTDDIAAFSRALREVQAGGGGDEPEAVEPALADALTKQSWSTDPGTIKLAFLVADAPPHIPGAPGQTDAGADDGPAYLDSARRYAETGIKLVPVASSNTNKVGESVFRELALVTGAPFLFLTYGADGRSPGSERPDLDVPEVDVLALDQLITTVITEEVGAAR